MGNVPSGQRMPGAIDMGLADGHTELAKLEDPGGGLLASELADTFTETAIMDSPGRLHPFQATLGSTPRKTISSSIHPIKRRLKISTFFWTGDK